MNSAPQPDSLRILGATQGLETVLSPAALAFVEALVREFRPRIAELLAARQAAQTKYDAGDLPGFRASTSAIRDSEWTVAPIPADLRDRRVEITGPVDAKMMINALGSGANVFMADCEDSCAPTWANLARGQKNLYEAVRRTLTFRDDARGKDYRLDPSGPLATLFVRPRGLHLPERHVTVDGTSIPGCLFDFGMCFFHNAREQLERGTGPYFYLPKLQSHLEARLWNDVFQYAQDALGIPRGTIRATVLIETLPAAFEMDEILWELKDHSAGLNCGRWDYIFSFIKTTRAHGRFVLPDRSQIGMTQPNMAAYTDLVIKTCHRRGIHAMGGMAAQIPIKTDPERNAAAMEKVRADKLREVKAGHDGTWVAHPGLIELARGIFDTHMPGDNQIDRARDDVQADTERLLAVPQGTRTEEGLRHNVRVGIQYMEAWLGGNGCVPLYDLMEDAATAEISRSQVWQWVTHRATLEGGKAVTPELVESVIDDEMRTIESECGRERFAAGHFPRARELFSRICVADRLEDFLTLVAYDDVVTTAPRT